MLRDLRRALSDAISESPDISRTLRRIREEGYTLYLMVDCKRDANDPDLEPEPMAPRVRRPSQAMVGSEPIFQIDGRDLAFLKSIGIDPTRRLRKRRRPVMAESDLGDDL